MYFLIIINIIIILIVFRIYYVLNEFFNSKKPKISDKYIESKLGFKVKRINIFFGQQLYQKLRQPDNRFQSFLPNIYRNAPSSDPLDGLHQSVRYVDTGDDGEDSGSAQTAKPVVVLLHGMPGSITDYEEFCREFGHKYRLIVPKLPDFELSRTSGKFWHSSEERTEFVVAFLNRLSITSIDCLVCHSAANPIALHALSGDFCGELEIKSLVMITPPGFKWLSEYQWKSSRRMCRLLGNWWGRWLYLFLMFDRLEIFFGVPKTLLKNCTKDQLFGMTYVAVMSGLEDGVRQKYELLAKRRVPTLYVMAEKDRLLAKWKYEKTLEMIDAQHPDLCTDIGPTGDYERRRTVSEWIQVLNFRFGGHFCFIKFAQVFHKEFQEFMESNHN